MRPAADASRHWVSLTCHAALVCTRADLQRAAQLDVRVAERDARWHCERWFSLSLLRGAAEVFFIDTSPGVLDYRAAPWAVNPGACALPLDIQQHSAAVMFSAGCHAQ